MPGLVDPAREDYSTRPMATRSGSLGIAIGLALSAGGAAVAQTPVVIRAFDGTVPGARFGSVCDFAGDCDGDGVDDLVVGMDGDDRNGAFAGAVAVLSGRHGETLFEVLGASGDRLGYAVAGIGDVNGDGRADVVAGAPFDDRGGTDAGAVIVVSGATGAVLWSAFGAVPFEQLGMSVAHAGDLDGDTRPDVAAGAPFSNLASELAGAVRAYSGTSGVLLRTWLGGVVGENLGWSVAAVGDVDRDGRGDLAMGGIERLRFGAGVVRVVSGTSGLELRVVRGASNEEFGHAIAGGPDWDQDGWPDMVVSTPARNVSTPLNSAGGLVVVSGRDGSTLATIAGRTRFQRLGHALALPGDLDGDGRVEIAAGSSNGTLEIWSFVGPTRTFAQSGAGRFGSVLADGGDIDDDGRDDLIVTAPVVGATQDGRIDVFAFTRKTLIGRPTWLRVASSGRQDWTVDAGVANAGRAYLVIGSLSGIAPGTPLGSITLPLNLDFYSVASISGANLLPFVNSLGALDGSGRAIGAFVTSPAVFGGLIGLTLDHACLLLPGPGSFDFASNPVPMRIVP